ncbi:cysteine hydrolase family protein [Treponema primitia]|uniref:cysteine hydrolase family protein n=1 Tax=Treponema primitia TaxID=88058 RepID=UPI000255563D|nr:cysteine hydrolase family protein [Treponema primitia]
MSFALILVDIQNDYFPGGSNTLYKTEEAAKNASMALEIFRQKKLPVFHIQHISLQTGATFFLPNTVGNEINKTVKPNEGETVLVKHKPNSFFETDLHECISKTGIKKLIICGMMTHMCIDTTVRAAKDYSYETIVLSDACTTKDLIWDNKNIPAETVHNVYMAGLQGTFAKIIKTNELKKILE